MRFVSVLLICSIVLAGCATEDGVFTPRTRQGAGIGAVVGGVLGAIIHDDNRWVGAAVGAAAGAVVGGAIGNIVDHSAREAATRNEDTTYNRTTADGTQEKVVATPMGTQGDYKLVKVEYYRNGVKVAEETKQVPVE